MSTRRILSALLGAALALSTVFVTGSASASVVAAVTVADLDVHASGLAFIYIDRDIPGKAPCAVENRAYGFDTRTDGGRAMLSLALAAKLSGKTLFIRGTGNSCTLGAESISILELE